MAGRHNLRERNEDPSGEQPQIFPRARDPGSSYCSEAFWGGGVIRKWILGSRVESGTVFRASAVEADGANIWAFAL